MPKIMERLVGQLKGKVDNPYAVATSQLQKHGILKKGTQELTPKGEQRQALGNAGRAKDRAAKASGNHAPSDYTYDPASNRATLAKGGPSLPRSGGPHAKNAP